MSKDKYIKKGQEQATAAWIDYLNQVRLNNLIEGISRQKENFREAMVKLDITFDKVNDLIDSRRGGEKGMHGFIAEIAECGIGNARGSIMEINEEYLMINNNGPIDLMRDGTAIQQKFVRAGGLFSLNAIKEHFNKYPDFIENGGKYQIPSDFYEKVKKLLDMPEVDANRLPSNGDLTLRDWKNVHNFFEENNIPIESLESSMLTYDSVQVNRINETLSLENENIKKTNDKKLMAIYEKSKPSLTEGLKVTMWSATIEGGTVLAISIANKLREGKSLNEFNEKDWEEISAKAGLGTLKGGIRGVSIYAMTNYTATPGAVASGIVTASFSIAEQAHLFRKGQISELEFIKNAELIALDASVSALSSLIGQVVIPIPVLGAVIGNTVGMIMYQKSKESLSLREETLIKEYIANQRILDAEFNREYDMYLNQLTKNIERYLFILESAFSQNPEEAFEGSIRLCIEMGVPVEGTLNTIEKRDDYFLN